MAHFLQLTLLSGAGLLKFVQASLEDGILSLLLLETLSMLGGELLRCGCVLFVSLDFDVMLQQMQLIRCFRKEGEMTYSFLPLQVDLFQIVHLSLQQVVSFCRRWIRCGPCGLGNTRGRLMGWFCSGYKYAWVAYGFWKTPAWLKR